MISEEREILRHSLGLNYDPPHVRNYYADEPDSKILSGLVDKGMMVRGREIEGGLQYFHVTEFGRVMADKQPDE